MVDASSNNHILPVLLCCMSRLRHPKGSPKGGRFKPSGRADAARSGPLALTEDVVDLEEAGFFLLLHNNNGKWVFSPTITHSALAAKMRTPIQNLKASYSVVLSDAVATLLNKKQIQENQLNQILPGIARLISPELPNAKSFTDAFSENHPDEALAAWKVVLAIRHKTSAKGNYYDSHNGLIKILETSIRQRLPLPGINCYIESTLFWDLLNKTQPVHHNIIDDMPHMVDHDPDETLALKLYNQHLHLKDDMTPGRCWQDTTESVGNAMGRLLVACWNAHKISPTNHNFAEDYIRVVEHLEHLPVDTATEKRLASPLVGLINALLYNSNRDSRQTVAYVWARAFELAEQGTGPYTVSDIEHIIYDWFDKYHWNEGKDFSEQLYKLLPEGHPSIVSARTMTYPTRQDRDDAGNY